MDNWLKELYPDVAALGGLGAAMKEAAGLRECDIGPVGSASTVVSIETGRGVLSVGLAAEERLFLVGIHIPGFTWATGSTDDLGLLVDAVAAWRRGIPLDDFEAKFEFMRLDEFARALEIGDPAPLQWSHLLSSEFYSGQWNLLSRVYSDYGLRDLFPTVTHGVVRLRVDPLDGGSRQLLVKELAGERYHVMTVGEPEATWIEVPADDLVAYLRAFRDEQ